LALRTPLYDWHVANGGRLVDFAGWDMPVQYTTITQEHEAVRHAAGLFDISHMGRLSIEGGDAWALLQRVSTNDVATMKDGQIRYGLICNEAGGILDDVLVYWIAPHWTMVVNASNREKILAWLDNHKEGLNARVIDRTAEWGMVAIQGPRAAAITAQLLPDPEQLKYYTGKVVPIPAGSFTMVSRTGYTGEDGFEIIVRSEHLPKLVERMMSLPDAPRPCGLGARDTLRLEAAMPLYGHELTEEIDPLQAGLAWAVKLDKGDFIGRDAIVKRSKDPALRRRVGLELDGKRIARESARVLADGPEVGKVTSGTFSPTLSKSIAMAYVEPERTGIGTQLEIDIRGKVEKARVVEMPFYRRRKK
jgi:aminomethyltransferase